MLGIKTVILVGQLGRIWSKNRVEIKVLQTLTSVAFFALFLKNNKTESKEEYNQFKNDL